MQGEALTEKAKTLSGIRTILLLGALWGIFEATVGYLLHLLPFNVGWIVWYPVACLFMALTYRRVKHPSSVFYVAVLCAGIKLINLALPIRIDKVLNPAVSIILEALSAFCLLLILARLPEEKRTKPYILALAALGANTAWRLLYGGYLLLIVPSWIRDVSVISSGAKLIRFLLTENLITSGVLFLAALALVPYLRKRSAEGNPAASLSFLPKSKGLQTAGVLLLLCVSIALQLLL